VTVGRGQGIFLSLLRRYSTARSRKRPELPRTGVTGEPVSQEPPIDLQSTSNSIHDPRRALTGKKVLISLARPAGAQSTGPGTTVQGGLSLWKLRQPHRYCQQLSSQAETGGGSRGPCRAIGARTARINSTTPTQIRKFKEGTRPARRKNRTARTTTTMRRRFMTVTYHFFELFTNCPATASAATATAGECHR